MTNSNDLIKIKEDVVKIQEADIADTIKSIESENLKSLFVLGFAAVLFGIVFGKIDKSGNGNSNTQGSNPLKPQETQKGITPEKVDKK